MNLMIQRVSSKLDQEIDQEYFNQVLFTTIGSFEYIAFQCNKKSKYPKYSYYCNFNGKKSLDEAINIATLQFENLISLLDSLKDKDQKVDFPRNVEPKDLEEDINSWISDINSYDPSLCDNCLKIMKEIVTERRKMAIASEYCYDSAFEKSKGECSAHVRNALNYAGFDFPDKNFNAYQFYKDENGVNHLELRGFKEMKLEDGLKNKMDGDIVVEEPKGKNIYGHIQIYNEKHDQWVSDFKQKSKDAMVHSSDIGVRHYYRYFPKYHCLIFQRQKKKKSFLENHINKIESKNVNYDRYNNSSSSYYYKDNDSINSFKVSDRVSIRANLDKSSDGTVGFKFNVGFSIPCIIF